jgi:hypothetical protein
MYARRGATLGMAICPVLKWVFLVTQDLGGLHYDHIHGRLVVVHDTEVARSYTYSHADRMEALGRWESAPVKVQQEVERRIRKSEREHAACVARDTIPRQD